MQNQKKTEIMLKGKYKYSLLGDSSVKYSETQKSDPWKILIFSALAVIIIIYYATNNSTDINNKIFLEIEEFSSFSTPSVLTNSVFNNESQDNYTIDDTTANPTIDLFDYYSPEVSDPYLISELPSTINNLSNYHDHSTTANTTPGTSINATTTRIESEISSSSSTSPIIKSSIFEESLHNSTIRPTSTPTSIVTIANSTEISSPYLFSDSPASTTNNVRNIFHSTTTKTTSTSTTKKIQLPKPKPQIKIKKNFKTHKYYVDTEQCHMPWVDPFEASVKKIFHSEKYQKCSSDKALISKVFNETQRRYILSTSSQNIEDINCCYQQIVRSGSGSNADNKFDLLPCTNFHQNFVVPQHVDAMIVDCKSRKTNKTIQSDALFFIQDRKEISDKKASNDSVKKLNVLLIGIDSLSRFNFRRNMPKTAEFLDKNNWFELEGYNKVGDNTYPNLMALLTGFNESIAYSKCMPKTVGGLNKCQFIWNHFKASGYETAYAEDETWLSTFNYIKKGFQKQPTDHYLRPFMMAIEKKMKIKKRWGMKDCIGRHHAAEYIYDFGLEFAKRRQRTPWPGFGLFWTNSFSHNSFTAPSTMDGKMLEYFEDLKNNGVLETSIVLFFSDHGMRWGPLMKLSEGFLEERLPMFFISLPKWFSKVYPNYVKALKTNVNRLTTPYDIYQSLKHILSLSQSSIKPTEPAFSCSAAQSVFYEISKNRTCKDACIPEHWCTCSPYEVLSPKSSEVLHVTDLIIDEINNYLKASNFTSLCSTLHRSSIKEALIKMVTPGVTSRTETFRIKFKVKPNDAYFQATAIYDLDMQKVQIVIEDVSRLNTYSKDSKCIDDKLAKKFCICKNKKK